MHWLWQRSGSQCSGNRQQLLPIHKLNINIYCMLHRLFEVAGKISATMFLTPLPGDAKIRTKTADLLLLVNAQSSLLISQWDYFTAVSLSRLAPPGWHSPWSDRSSAVRFYDGWIRELTGRFTDYNSCVCSLCLRSSMSVTAVILCCSLCQVKLL